MSDIVERARAAQHDERLSDGALYGALADEIQRLQGEIAYLKTLIAEALDEIQRMKLEAANERFEPTA